MDRIGLIASHIYGSFADIGTDHGHLAVAARKNGNSSSIILTDISRDSLGKAMCNCRDLNVDFRAGDGLEVIDNGAADTVVIAGMGGRLIADIIEKDIDKSRSFERLILQPRNNAAYLRMRLVKDGFTITDDELVREGKYICNVITAVPGHCDTDFGDDDIRWEIPFEAKDGELFRGFIESLIAREKKIISGLNLSRDEKEMANAHQRNIEVLEGVLYDKG